MSQDGQAEEPFDEAQGRPLGLPKGSVRSLMSLGVVLAAGAIAGFLLVEDTTADLTKMVVGGLDRRPGQRYRVLLRDAQRRVTRGGGRQRTGQIQLRAIGLAAYFHRTVRLRTLPVSRTHQERLQIPRSGPASAAEILRLCHTLGATSRESPPSARRWRNGMPRSSYECLRTSGEVRHPSADAEREPERQAGRGREYISSRSW